MEFRVQSWQQASKYGGKVGLGKPQTEKFSLAGSPEVACEQSSDMRELHCFGAVVHHLRRRACSCLFNCS